MAPPRGWKSTTQFLIAAVQADAVLDAVEQLEYALRGLDEPQPDDVIDLVVTLCTRAYWAIEVARRRDPAS